MPIGEEITRFVDRIWAEVMEKAVVEEVGPVIFVYLPDMDRWAMTALPIRMFDNAGTKVALFEGLSKMMKEHNAGGCVFITEGWASQQTEVAPRDDPEKVESLLLQASDPYGDSLFKRASFYRVEGGGFPRIVQEEDNSEIQQVTFNLIRPWRKHAPQDIN